MLATAIIVFREVLEASLVIGIVAAATVGLRKRGLWISLGILGGVAGAGCVAAATGFLSTLFDGAGQDLLDAGTLFLAVALIGWHIVWMSSHGREIAQKVREAGASVSEGRKHMSVLALVVGLAVMREGSEIVLMLQGLWAGSSAADDVAGFMLGLAGGAGAGAVMYFGFLALPVARIFAVTNFILVLIAGGMAARGANFLVQAGLVRPFGSRLWDSSWLLSDQSPLGQLLGALVGYIAKPSGIEVAAYAATVVVVIGLARMIARQAQQVRAVQEG